MKPQFVQVKQVPQFPDFSSNYQATIVIPQIKAAEEAAKAAQNVVKAQAVELPPTPPPTPQTASSSSMMSIFMKESGNNPGAINASNGACGLGQALPCSKMPCSLSDYNCQVNFFTGYAVSRYGSWDGAWAFWLGHSWW